MKKILLFLFAVAIFQVAKAETLTVDGINYNIVSNADFTCEVTSSNFYYSGSIAIPETITDYGTDYTVVGIGSYAFEWCDQLLNIIIPETVTYIDYGAFLYCTNLTKITLPESLTTIDGSAFNGCSSLTEITIPENVTYIGDNAFNNCYSLTTLNFNAIACTSCSYNSFPSSITTVNMGDKVTVIPPYFYYEKTALTSIDIPTSVTEIGQYAYYGCTGLTEITIPKNVKTINSYAFYGCENLTEVTIPENVTTLASNSFGGCNFVTLNFNATSCEVSGSRSPFYESTKINTVNFGSKVTKIPNYFLQNATRIRTVTLPASLISIGDYAFYGCTGLSEIVIPDKVITIGSDAFYGCTSVTVATIGEAVTEINNYAFYNTNIETLNYNAKNCTSSMSNDQFPSTITTLNIGEKVKTIPAYLCYNFSITEVTIPDRVTTIGDYAFYNCTSLTSVSLGCAVNYIGYYAFSNCSSLTAITSYNKTPPTCYNSNSFPGSYIYVTVDQSVVDTYKSASVWSSFYYYTSADFTDYYFHAEAMNAAYDTEEELENIWAKISDTNATTEAQQLYNDILNDILAIETAIDEAYQNGTISEELVAGFLESLESLNDEISEFTEDEIDEALEKCEELLGEIADLLEEVEDNTSFQTSYENLQSTFRTYTLERTLGYDGSSFFDEVYSLLDDIIDLRSDIRSYLRYSDAIVNITIDPAEKVEVARYNLQGQRLAQPQRGVNIIRYSDGSTQKVLVK